MNTADYLLQRGEDQDLVLITKDTKYSYHYLREVSARMLGELISSDVNPADRVGILADNSLFWVASYLAILKLGAIAVPFPTILTVEDFQRKERFINCKAICMDRRAYRTFSTAFANELILIRDDVLKKPGPTSWKSVQTDYAVHQDAALMLTSGTTMRPRAVRITHRNIQANTDSIINYLDLTKDDRILVVLPFYYCFGTSLLHTHLRVGGSLTLCNTFAYPETALNMIESTNASGFAGVPSIFQSLLRNTSFPNRDLKLRKVQQAGGKLPRIFIRELIEAIPNAQIFIMYGQTEATARLSYLPPDLLASKLGSVGLGIPGVELRVLNEQGIPVKPREVGEIYASGDNISPGYFNDPEATEEKFNEGILRTGDLATVDEDGFIYIVDRKDDFIKSMGHRISSQEIEAQILQLPEVVSAAAIGVPDNIQGEAIMVFVTLRIKASVSPEEIVDYCRKHMARHMVPKEVIIIDQLPMNPHGKIVKSRLREMAESKEY